jgi:hypothetical protein
MVRLIQSIGREVRPRNTLYGEPADERIATALNAPPLTAVHNRPARLFKAAS